ncbi:hypothetical protein HN51_007286, partial [Arachis hypogaea]
MVRSSSSSSSSSSLFFTAASLKSSSGSVFPFLRRVDLVLSSAVQGVRGVAGSVAGCRRAAGSAADSVAGCLVPGCRWFC